MAPKIGVYVTRARAVHQFFEKEAARLANPPEGALPAAITALEKELDEVAPMREELKATWNTAFPDEPESYTRPVPKKDSLDERVTRLQGAVMALQATANMQIRHIEMLSGTIRDLVTAYAAAPDKGKGAAMLAALPPLPPPPSGRAKDSAHMDTN